MTIDFCAQVCMGVVNNTFGFFGLEITKCYCFETLVGAQPLSNRNCHVRCPGDSGQLCGGKGVMNVHNLVNDTVEDVMVLAGGWTDSDGITDSTVIMSGATECKSHGIPEMPNSWVGFGFAVLYDAVLVRCGGRDRSGGNGKKMLFI